MFFRWLKHYMPRSLYGRAALILILPVVSIQLVVSVAFIQRHLEDVTSQMSMTLVRELDVITSEAAMAETPEIALALMRPYLSAFEMDVTFIAKNDVPDEDYIRWYDYSARVVRETIESAVPRLLAAEFPDNRSIQLYIDSDLGPARINFSRPAGHGGSTSSVVCDNGVFRAAL